MTWSFAKLAASLFLASAFPAFAGPGEVKAIEFRGLEKTKEVVARREVLLREGEAFDRLAFEASIRNLKNLSMFSDARGEVREGADGKTVVFELIESWTLLPYITFSAGGGVSQYELGLFDVNFMGTGTTLGAWGQFVGGQPGATLWFRDPRFLGEKLYFEAEGNTSRKIDPLTDRNGILQGGFMRKRKQLLLQIRPELAEGVQVGLGLDYINTAFETASLGAEYTRANRVNSFELPQDESTLRPSVSFRVGRVDNERANKVGSIGEIVVPVAISLRKENKNFAGVRGTLLSYHLLPLESNLALRLQAGFRGTEKLSEKFAIGALREIRGFRDENFRGKAMWNANAELRFPFVDLPSFVAQAAAFTDLGDAGDKGSEVLKLNGKTPWSIGAGVRLNATRIYGLIVRMDLARTLQPYETTGFSASLGHFY